MRRHLLKKFSQIMKELFIDLFFTKRGIFILVFYFVHSERGIIRRFIPEVSDTLYFLLRMSEWITYIFIIQLIIINVIHVVSSKEDTHD